MIHDILKAVLGIFYVYKSDREKFEEWTTCKQYVTGDLSNKITTYDPTAKESTKFVDSKALAKILQRSSPLFIEGKLVVIRTLYKEAKKALFDLKPTFFHKYHLFLRPTISK